MEKILYLVFVMNIIILTPAIPRPDIHTKTFISFYNTLKKTINTDTIKVTHIINIDCPQKILDKGYNLKDTIINFDNIVPKKVNKIYLTGYKPDFSSSYCRLFVEAEKYANDNSIIIFLEDDWMFKDDFSFDDILKCLPKYLLLTDTFLVINNKMPDNSPHVMSYGLYKLYVAYIKSLYKHFTEIEHADPDNIRHCFYKFHFRKFSKKNINVQFTFYDYEKTSNMKFMEDKENTDYYYYKTYYKHIYINENKLFYSLGKEFVQNKLKSTIDICVFRHKSHNRVYDIGRPWMRQQQIKKWDKKQQGEKTY